MDNILEKFKNNIISLLFSIIGSEIIFYSIYRGFNLLASLAILIITVALYVAFDKIVELKKKGILLYLIIGVIMLALSYFFIKSSSDIATMSFYQWSFSGGKNVGEYIGYIIGGVIFISFVFSSLSYYFSVTHIRIGIMYLLVFIVMIVYTKNMLTKFSIIVSVFTILSVLLFILTNRKEDPTYRVNIRVKSKHILLPSMALILILFLVASMIPNVTKLPQGFNGDDNNNPFSDNGGNGGNNGGSNGSSGNNGNGSGSGNSGKGGLDNSPSDKDINKSSSSSTDSIVYGFIGDNPGYIIDHVYSTFEDNQWKSTITDISDDPNLKTYAGVDITKGGKKKEVENTVEYLSRANNLDEELAKIKKAKSDGTLDKEMYLAPYYNSFQFLSHPPYTNKVTNRSNDLFKFDDNRELLFMDNGEIFSNRDYYIIDYVADEAWYGSKEDKIMRYMTKERYLNFIKNNLSEDEYNTIANNMRVEESEYAIISDDTTDRMKKLAEELTANCDSTYDKAKAIEKYFTSGDYKYSLKLKKQSKDNYIDYFIFESKKGYCVQYATAMTLLCRAAGLPAKYAEGYSIDPDDVQNDVNLVRESRGHAFVQVHIPGYGWKIFDPTPSVFADDKEKDKEEEDEENDFKVSKKVIIISAISLGSIVLVSVSVYLYLKLTKRKRLLKKISKLSDEEAFEAIMKDSLSLLEEEKIGFRMYDGETLMNFAKRVDSSINIGISKVVEMYYGYKYAFKPFNKAMLDEAKEINETIYNMTKEK